MNHDYTDETQLKYFGITDGGRYVEMNRPFVEADLMIYQDNVAAGAWRGYSGTGVAVGLASTKSISHHSYYGIPTPSAKVAANQVKSKATQPRRLGVKEDMTKFLDEAMGRPVFYVNAFNGGHTIHRGCSASKRLCDARSK